MPLSPPGTSAILLLWLWLLTKSLLAVSVHCNFLQPIRTIRSHLSPSLSTAITDTESKDSAYVTSNHECPGSTVSTPSTGTSETTENKEKRKSSIELVRFTAAKTLRSEPLPLPPSKTKTVDDFFASNEYVDLQFADRANVVQIPDPDESMMEIFRRYNEERRIEAGLTALAEDVHSTRIIRLDNPPMHCLGLTLHSVTNVGIQLLKGSHDNGRPNQARRYPGFPELQLTLLRTSFEATGPKFLVRLFYKIMPQSSNIAERQEAVDTIGFTRIWAEPVVENSTDAVVFVDQARLESRITVPRLLMRVMPMSKQKMERRGSNTLQNAIEKDMVPAMDRFKDAYLKWISSVSS